MASPQQKKAMSTTTAAHVTPPASQDSHTVVQQLNFNDLNATTPPASAPPPVSPLGITRPVKRRRIVRITAPEPGSLYDIMHDHQGESLYNFPICWTDAHARLLSVNFVDQKPIRKPVPDFNSFSSKYPPRPSRVATELSKDLTSILTPVPGHFDTASITQVLCTFFPSTLSKPKSNLDLELHFGDRTLKKAVRVTVLWKHAEAASCASFDSATTKPASSYGRVPTSASQGSSWNSINSLPKPDKPILAFVNRSQLALVRRNLYRVSLGPLDGDRQNLPVMKLQKMRSKRLIPENSDRDSYLVAVMVAIAQSQCYPPRISSKSPSQKSFRAWNNNNQASSPKPKFKDVAVRILSQNCETAEFVVYSTTVTADFLRRFAEPMKAPSIDALHNGGLQVDVTKVPVWPVLGLKERLAQALGSEISGEDLRPMYEGIQTWESEAERSLRLGSLKRGRDVLSEVFNTSFDLDDDDSGRRPSFSIPSPGPGAGLGITTASPSLSPRTPKRRRTEGKKELEVC